MVKQTTLLNEPSANGAWVALAAKYLNVGFGEALIQLAGKLKVNLKASEMAATTTQPIRRQTRPRTQLQHPVAEAHALQRPRNNLADRSIPVTGLAIPPVQAIHERLTPRWENPDWPRPRVAELINFACLPSLRQSQLCLLLTRPRPHKERQLHPRGRCASDTWRRVLQSPIERPRPLLAPTVPR